MPWRTPKKRDVPNSRITASRSAWLATKENITLDKLDKARLKVHNEAKLQRADYLLSSINEIRNETEIQIKKHGAKQRIKPNLQTKKNPNFKESTIEMVINNCNSYLGSLEKGKAMYGFDINNPQINESKLKKLGRFNYLEAYVNFQEFRANFWMNAHTLSGFYLKEIINHHNLNISPEGPLTRRLVAIVPYNKVTNIEQYHGMLKTREAVTAFENVKKERKITDPKTLEKLWKVYKRVFPHLSNEQMLSTKKADSREILRKFTVAMEDELLSTGKIVETKKKTETKKPEPKTTKPQTAISVDGTTFLNSVPGPILGKAQNAVSKFEKNYVRTFEKSLDLLKHLVDKHKLEKVREQKGEILSVFYKQITEEFKSSNKSAQKLEGIWSVTDITIQNLISDALAGRLK